MRLGFRLAIEQLGPLSLSHRDLEPTHGDAPQAVIDLRSAIGLADGLVIVSPEYNYGISGVLKNALDWASRPAYRSVLARKPVLIITNSPGALGGVRAYPQLRSTLASTLSRVVARPEIVISNVAEKIIGGRLSDDMTR